MVIRASVLGCLLGIRLLRLEADISLVPADLDSSSTVGPSTRVVTSSATTAGTGGLADAAELLAHASRTLDETPHLVTARKRGPDRYDPGLVTTYVRFGGSRDLGSGRQAAGGAASPSADLTESD